MILYNIKDLSALIRKYSDVLPVLFFTTETRPPASPSCRLYEQEAIGPTSRWEDTENFYLFAHWEAALGKKPLPSVIKAQLFRSTNFSISAAIEPGTLNIAPIKKAASFDTAFQICSLTFYPATSIPKLHPKRDLLSHSKFLCLVSSWPSSLSLSLSM